MIHSIIVFPLSFIFIFFLNNYYQGQCTCVPKVYINCSGTACVPGQVIYGTCPSIAWTRCWATMAKWVTIHPCPKCDTALLACASDRTRLEPASRGIAMVWSRSSGTQVYLINLHILELASSTNLDSCSCMCYNKSVYCVIILYEIVYSCLACPLNYCWHLTHAHS